MDRDFDPTLDGIFSSGSGGLIILAVFTVLLGLLDSWFGHGSVRWLVVFFFGVMGRHLIGRGHM